MSLAGGGEVLLKSKSGATEFRVAGLPAAELFARDES